MRVCIVGGGPHVYFLSRSFLSKGHSVTIINKNHSECVDLARRLKATVVHGDGTEPSVLEEAGVREADEFLAVTPFDHDNLVACQLAHEEYGVERVLALVDDPDNEPIYRKLGVDTFSTTKTVVSMLEQRTAVDGITNLIPIGSGQVNGTEVLVEEASPAAGKTIRELSMPEDSLIAVVMREDRPIIPSGTTTVEVGDRLVLITLPHNFAAVIRLITGERS